MDIAVSGLPELPDMPFCDFFIRRQQFIYRVYPRQNRRKNDENSPHIPGDAITLILAHRPEKLTVPPKKSTGYSVGSFG